MNSQNWFMMVKIAGLVAVVFWLLFILFDAVHGTGSKTAFVFICFAIPASLTVIVAWIMKIYTQYCIEVSKPDKKVR